MLSRSIAATLAPKKQAKQNRARCPRRNQAAAPDIIDSTCASLVKPNIKIKKRKLETPKVQADSSLLPVVFWAHTKAATDRDTLIFLENPTKCTRATEPPSLLFTTNAAK